MAVAPFSFTKNSRLETEGGVDYFGYDHAVSYINIGLAMYPELAKSYAVESLDSSFKPRESDVAVMSATLEHLPEWRFVLRSILRATRSALVLRTFLGEQNLTHWLRKSDDVEPYLVQQFAYEEFCRILAEENSYAEIVRDDATLSLPKFVPAGKGSVSCVRTCYVVVCRPI